MALTRPCSYAENKARFHSPPFEQAKEPSVLVELKNNLSTTAGSYQSRPDQFSKLCCARVHHAPAGDFALDWEDVLSSYHPKPRMIEMEQKFDSRIKRMTGYREVEAYGEEAVEEDTAEDDWMTTMQEDGRQHTQKEVDWSIYQAAQHRVTKYFEEVTRMQKSGRSAKTEEWRIVVVYPLKRAKKYPSEHEDSPPGSSLAQIPKDVSVTSRTSALSYPEAPFDYGFHWYWRWMNRWRGTSCNPRNCRRSEWGVLASSERQSFTSLSFDVVTQTLPTLTLNDAHLADACSS
ncbi:uncharacterized protein EV420DRAFT_1480670 [Desarmillaria tabescens]|uniref:Uncharacterized protein n=1 Tax=Armillaria tabescens TaxID=1929756 RepID=A0AA39KAJ3_ARMTA|nr:uncharacterized protein EV420DRAFT_1480670 [Desarmillaria tabescens]KAK0457611.1 hypothetical protein EV420DRAFT_1480670 [Desarmillaria tabescens]